MKRKSQLRHSLFIAASSSLVIISTASAQTWDGGGADNNWSSDLNWNTDVAPISGATLTFAGTTRRSNTNNLTADTVIGGINFTNNSGGTASQFTLSGNRITLGGNITTTAATGTTFTDLVSIPILLNGNRTITTNANHSVSLNATISETGGAFGLIKAGASALTLAGNNTYTGVTAINAGAIRLAHNNGLGSTVGNTTIAANGTTGSARIQFTSAAINTAENIHITGNSETAQFVAVIDGGGTLSGAITFTTTGTSSTRGIRFGGATLSGTLTQLTSTSDLVLNSTTINNAINNNGGRVVVYGGGATLKGVSGSGIGATIIDQNGTLKIGITDALNTANELNIGPSGTQNATFDLASFDQTIRGLTSGSTGTARSVINSVASSVSTLTLGNSTNTSSSFTFNGRIRDNNGTGGTVALVKTGTGTQTLSGANTFSGGTTFSGGNLVAGNSSAFGTGDITFSGTALGLTLSNGVNIANDITIGTNSGVAGHGLIKVANSQTATLSGTITINNAASAGGHFGGITGNSTGLTNINGEINATVPVSQRSGTVVLRGGGSYTKYDLMQGTTRIGVNNGMSTTATVGIAGSGAATLDLNGVNQTLVGITRDSTSNTATITNNHASLNSTLTTTGTSTYAGVIQGARTALTVNGGSLTLSGTSNTYTGATNVSAGTLRVNGNIAAGSAVSVSSGATLAGAGTVSGTVALSGNLAPGNGTLAAGTLTTGTTTWDNSGIFNFDLGETSDRLTVSGVFTKGTALEGDGKFTFNFSGSPTLFTPITVVGFDSSTFALEDFKATGIDGTFTLNSTNLQFTPVPEASNLLIGGLLGLGLLRRRRNGATN